MKQSANSSQRKAEQFISAEARTAIRQAIADNGGAEVFFVGKLDEHLVVREVEAHAFGTRNAVPALKQLAKPGDVVIHNHPGGRLEPSEEDVGIASSLGSMNVGSYIVDNACRNLRVIVKPIAEKKIEPLDQSEVRSYLAPESRIARALGTYEYRPQQMDMLRAAVEAFNSGLIAVIEAGTGTGKSLAYLLPAILWSRSNGERVVISTNTINLQEQLVYKDIPMLQEKAGLQFTSELVKGRSNYVCKRRVEFLRSDPLARANEERGQELEALLEWANRTKDGSLADLSTQPSGETWESLECEADNCLRIKCQYYEDCFFYNARRRAARADVIVANHHILMADLALRRETDNYTAAAILPPFSRIIIDEAHNIEEVATSYFGSQVTRFGLEHLLGKLTSARKEDKGLLFFFAKKLLSYGKPGVENIYRDLLSRLQTKILSEVELLRQAIGQRFDQLIDLFLHYASEDKGESADDQIKLRITRKVTVSDLWTNGMEPLLDEMIKDIRHFVSQLRRWVRRFGEIPDEHQQELLNPLLELNAILERLETAGRRLGFFASAADDGYCRWVEYTPGKRRRRADQIKFCSAPIHIGEGMREVVYRANKTVVMTSATLTVAGKFDYFLRQVGLRDYGQDKRVFEGVADEIETEKELEEGFEKRLLLQRLDAPFVYEEQSFVGVPIDIDEPRGEGYEEALKRLILKALVISEGRGLVLFTNYRLLDSLYEELSPVLAQLGYDCLKQGTENRHKLLERFKRDVTSVLFATSSFWEGIDVPGEALECLIMTKLPFRVPTEPIMEARAEELARQGRDPFLELDVPHAVIKFKQGFGRLIRTRDDRGAVLILDRRVITKSYGRSFLASLPTKKIYQCSVEELLREMKAFFGRG